MEFTKMALYLHTLFIMISVSAADSQCGGKPADIVFILDASASIWGPHFDKQVSFVRSVAEQFDVGADTTRVSAMTFGDHAYTHFDLQRYGLKQNLLEAIGYIHQSGGGTRTDSALLRTREMFSRQSRDSVAKLAIVMTDGLSDYPDITREEALLLHEHGVNVFVVGIGDKVDEAELMAIASQEKYVFYVDNFDDLNSKVKKMLAYEACAVEIKADKAENSVLQTVPPKGCDGKPADIVFALDSSTSIWAPDFDTQLSFVQDLISVFEIGHDKTRIGLMTFSSKPHKQFHMDKYDNETDIKEAIGQINQTLGTTRTDMALHTMRAHYLTDIRARPGVVRIGIVITDGQSDDSIATARQASLARKAGIHLFAIGVGSAVKDTELRNIASRPSDQYVFTVKNYNALSTIKEILAIQTCKVTDPPTTLPPTTTPLPTTTSTTELPQADAGCGLNRPADLVFSLPPEAASADTRQSIRFIKDVIAEFDIASDKVRLGMVPKRCESHPGFHLMSSTSKEKVLKMFDMPEMAQSDTTTILKYMRTKSFKDSKKSRNSVGSPGAGSTHGRKKIGVLIIDRDSPDLARTATEAFKARHQHDIELFVVAVGKKVTQAQAIASQPADQHVLAVSSYRDLKHITAQLRQRINDICSGL